MTAPIDEARLRELAEAGLKAEEESDFQGMADADQAIFETLKYRDILALLDALSAERERADRAVAALGGLLAFVWQMTSQQFIDALYNLYTPGLELCDNASLVAKLDAAQAEAWSAIATQKAEGA